jgi:hypothetical protein
MDAAMRTLRRRRDPGDRSRWSVVVAARDDEDIGETVQLDEIGVARVRAKFRMVGASEELAPGEAAYVLDVTALHAKPSDPGSS